MAGLKAIVLWFPPERIALANGWFIMLDALGAVTATAPAEIVLSHMGWRGVFAVLAVMTAVSALVVLLVVPERRHSATPDTPGNALSIVAIYRTRVSGAWRRCRRPASARPGRCRACGPPLGSPTSLSSSAPWS
jgi:predicted MFS family arabinose efflux permease